jgi:hypothetical protein
MRHNTMRDARREIHRLENKLRATRNCRNRADLEDLDVSNISGEDFESVYGGDARNRRSGDFTSSGRYKGERPLASRGDEFRNK